MDYFNILGKISKLNRTHNGPETYLAYKILKNFYKKSRLIFFKKGKINYWISPPYWECSKAKLIDLKTKKILADKNNSNLDVYTYSPSIKKKILFKELKEHITTDPKRPNSKIFYFRNQYRHWDLKWCFSIPYNIFKKIKKNKKF